jgi:hypothetical protein
MSASPQRFNLVPPNTSPEVPPGTETQSGHSELLAQIANAIQAGNRARLYSTVGIVLTFAVGILAGYFLYLLWEQVSLHDSQIAQQQTTIQRLTANEATVSNQVGRLRTLDGSVDSLRAQLDLQSRRLAELEKGQTGIRDQVTGMNTRWQREIRALGKAKQPVAVVPPAAVAAAPVATASVPEKTAPQVPSSQVAQIPQQSAEKHNETFSPDLKPTPNAYAQMSPRGLVVWMTPRPGFAKPVPASVIGHVRGLGMLIHDWDDNNHYFITESGSWISDQR